MTSVVLVSNDRQIDEWRRRLKSVAKPSEINSALVSAINRALDNVRSVTAKGVREKYTVKGAAIKRAQTMHKATRSSMAGVVQYKGRQIGLEDFKITPGQPISWKGKPNPARVPRQLSAEIKRGEAETFKGGFLRAIYTEEPRVYKRVSTKRFPVTREGMRGPAVATMIEDSGAAAKAQASGNETLSKRIDHEMMRMLRKG